MQIHQTFRSRLGRALLLAAGSAAVLGLGAVAAFTQLDAGRALERVHSQDREALQADLSGLAQQYFDGTLLATQTAADETSWHLDARDTEGLHHLAHTSPLTSYGAALVSLTGTTLASWSSGGALPAVTSPGLSDVLHAGNDDVVAFAVPVQRDGRTNALLVAYAGTTTWPLEGYDRSLQIGPDAVPFILDSRGVVAASGDPGSLGRRLDLPLAHSTRELSWHGRQLVVSAADAGHGWTTLTSQPSSSWSPGVAASRQRALIALAVLLTVVIVLLLWFYRRQQNVQRRLAEERLRDVLTGLPQRRMFDMRLQAAFARQKRYGGTVALLYCDLDEFKAVNDQHGHLVGDQLLCAVAERLTSAVRENDFVVRFGGDEFGALVEGTSLAELAELVSRLQTIVQKPVTLGGVEITPRLSVGGAITTGGRGRDELVRAADLAMYQVKAGAPGLVLTDLDRPATASPSEAATNSGS